MTTHIIRKTTIAIGVTLALTSQVLANSVILSQDGDALEATLTQVGVGQSIAAQQIGVLNFLVATQAGVGSSLIVLQDGYINDAVTWQEGDGNSMDITQLGDLGNTIDYFAQGDDNYAILFQSGYNQLYATTYGDGNGVIASQTGDSNLIDVYTDGQDNGVNATQSGAGNLALYNIDGSDGVYIYSWQSGQSNEAYIDALARNSGAISTDNDVAVIQDGDRNLTDVLIRGDGSYVSSEQYGFDNYMRVTQPAHHSNSVASIQEGSDNSLIVHMGGPMNSYNSHQWGSENDAEVTFSARRNSVISDQYGELNSLSLLISNENNAVFMGQYGINNLIEGIGGGVFRVDGDGGSVALLQVGSDNLIQGHQMSDASSMNVAQFGSYNMATITQQ